MSCLQISTKLPPQENPEKAESAEQDAEPERAPLRITEQQPDLESGSKSDWHKEEQPQAFQETEVKPYKPTPVISEGNVQEHGKSNVQENRVPIYIGLGLLAIVVYFFVLYPWPFFGYAKPTSILFTIFSKVREQDGMEMVYVPESRFTMGSTMGYSDEEPVRKVYLDAYWIDKFEVTNAQYARCVVDGACS